MTTLDEKIACLREALEAVRHVPCTRGGTFELWQALIQILPKEDSRQAFEEALLFFHSSAKSLVSLWCAYAEHELSQSDAKAALGIARRAVAGRAEGGRKSLQRFFKAAAKDIRLWNLLVDLEEACGTLASTRAAYDRMIEMKLATPRTFLNYAQLLEEHRFFEDSFKVYERGLVEFTFPHVADIWKTYLSKFVKRHGAAKMERARDLFEQCCTSAPAKFAKVFFHDVRRCRGSPRHAAECHVHLCASDAQSACGRNVSDVLPVSAKGGKVFWPFVHKSCV